MKLNMRASAFAIGAAGLLLTGAAQAQSRDQIRIVGSSTVYPFTTAVAEQFGRASGKTPVVESTGTGGGMKLFCAGVGAQHPDATNASRRIKASEFEMCKKNGVDVVELKVGYDGIVIANAKAGPDFKVTKAQLFLALAKQVPGPDGKLVANPNMNWNDIDPALPAQKIEVLGPPPTSGTRDAFLELVMEPGAEEAGLADLKESDEDAFETVWKTLREDGGYVDAGENDNLIVQKLTANPNAVGIFGYSFLEANLNTIKGATVNGQVPTYEAIAAGEYPVSRPLFIYFKKQHVGLIPGLDKFAAEYVSDKALGEEGYLAEKGLVTLPEDELAKAKATVGKMEPLTGAGL